MQNLTSDLYIFQMTNLMTWVPKFYISWWKWRFLKNLPTQDKLENPQAQLFEGMHKILDSKFGPRIFII